jgi:GrpB-like predicted nucleotidyltransferase (UPF0157 family)/pimeloyl-ACP methyl ester carboxylesterase
VPVLFIAGAASGRSMTFGADLLDEVGITLVTVDRPGMGSSDPDPGRTLTSTATDLGAVADQWGSPLPVVANSQGAPFGLACAARGVARRLILVSPVDEVAVEPARSALSAERRGYVDAVRADPTSAERVLASLGAAGMERMVLETADEVDRDVYADAAFRAMYQRALREGFRNGGAGYAADTRIAMSPWEIDLRSISVDVEVVMGGRDRVHTADLGAALASRIPAARHTVIDGGGGAVLWTHSHQVLRSALGIACGSSYPQTELLGGPEKRPILIAPYDAGWPRVFARERNRIVDALGPTALRVDHVGSTSVPGLAAKPIVDINVSVRDPDDEAAYVPALTAAGYVLRVREPGHRMLRTPELDVHVHVCPAGGDWERRHVLFRDWLRVDAGDRASYAELKVKLARREWPDMNLYAAAKGPKIAEITARAEAWARQTGWQLR